MTIQFRFHIVLLFLVCFVLSALPAPARPVSSGSKDTGKSLSERSSIWVSRFEFDGNRVYTDAELRELVRGYENRWISPEDLLDVTSAVSRHYVNGGYVNSGAVIPDQQVKDGNVSVAIVEGTLDRVVVNGIKGLKESYVVKRLANTDGKAALNIHTLQEKLKLLEQDPHISTLHARLVPGTEPGDAELYVTINEAPRMEFSTSISNHASPGTGSLAFDNDITVLNVSGRGDDVIVETRLTQGLKQGLVYYSLPVNSRGATISAEAERTDSRVVTQPFSELDITGESMQGGLSFRYPLMQSVSQELAVGIKLDRFVSKTYLDGHRFSFSEGSEDGETIVNSVRLNQEYVLRSLTRVAAFRMTETFGIDPFDDSTGSGDTDGDFFTWQGQLRYIQRIGGRGSVLQCRINAQLANDPLPTSERFSAGGAESVRGYRENSLTRDEGVEASIEVRLPLTEVKLPYISRGVGDGLLSVVPFFDWAGGKNKSGDRGSVTIAGTGAGLIWDIGKNLAIELFYGKSLNHKEKPAEHDLQDDGIHFKIQADF